MLFFMVPKLAGVLHNALHSNHKPLLLCGEILMTPHKARNNECTLIRSSLISISGSISPSIKFKN